jgi:SAM-dependent methyltransferase
LPPEPAWTNADAYEIFMGRWSALLAPAFLATARVPAGSRVLDLGCGTGVLSMALANAGAHVVGVDASAAYLEAARRQRGHPSVAYEHGDASRLRFAAGCFDAAVCTLLLDILPDAEAAVAEMRRVTRPGGIVASALHDFWGAPYASLVWDTAAVLDPGMAELRDTMKAGPLAGAGRQAELWRRAGLTEVTEVPLVVDCEYAGFDDYWASFAGGQGRVAVRLLEVPQDVLAEIKRHVRAGYLAGMVDGPRSFPMLFRAVRGAVPS